MPFIFKRLEIPEVILITPKVFKDDRGFFMETFKNSDFKSIGIELPFLQDSHSKSKKGVIRGLHYQLNPHPQGKLVRAIRGSLFDVAVDIRKGSPYYGKWVGAILSEENKKMLWIPPGFAHGVCTLEEDTELLYKVTSEYAPEYDRGIRWDDPIIGIDWPISNPTSSKKDDQLPSLENCECNFIFPEK